MGRLIDKDKLVSQLKTSNMFGHNEDIPEYVFQIIEQMPCEQQSPCDVCIYYPPSSMDGKGCCACPAEGRSYE